MITFEIPGAPQGKARARTFYNHKIGRMTSMTPDKTVLYENLIKMCYQQTTDYISEKPLEIVIRAYFEPAKSTPKNKRALMLGGDIKPLKKPDVDNIAKVILDALNGVAYKDDSQVVLLLIGKSYSKYAHVEVNISEAGGLNG